jgi:hypothetical protein
MWVAVGGDNLCGVIVESNRPGENMAKALVFTKHALAVMSERQIDPDWVTRTVLSPQWREADLGDPNVQRRFSALQERGGRYLRVACVETATEIRILSAFLDRRARPK